MRLLIVDPHTDRLLGSLSLTAYGDDPASAELGLWTVADERGRGIGGRAVRLVCDWALAELPLERIVGRTDPDNVASRHVMERLGFELIGPVGDQVAYERRSANRPRTRSPGSGGACSPIRSIIPGASSSSIST